MDTIKEKLTELKWRLVGILGKAIIDLIFSTSKIESAGYERVALLMRSKNVIAPIWHSRILIFTYLYRTWNVATMVSQSDDGEIIARILKQQGFEPVRGSTTRGGARALAGLVRLVKEGYTAVLIPDGPQGPRYKIQPGVISLAKKTGVPIIPVTYSARKAFFFPSWDRFMLPRPFNHCHVIYGEPFFVPENADRPAEEMLRIRLENELNRITAEADRYFGHDIS
ncbi:MAG: lysophospholipid acyltransferase family protein [Desulfococcaceae bacterium]